MLLWVMMWNLRMLAQLQESEISPGLSQDLLDEHIKFLRLPQLLIEQLVPNQEYCQSMGSQSVVLTVGFKLEDPSSNTMSS